MEVILSDKARSDLLRIYHYLEARSPNAADVFARRVDSNLANLRRFPFIGRDRPGLLPGLQCLVVGNHLFFYKLESDQVVVVRVIDGRMDVDDEFFR